MSKECVLIRKFPGLPREKESGTPIHFLHMGQGYSVTNTSRYAARFDLAPGRGKAVSALLATPPTTKMHFFLSCERRPKPLDAPWGRHALPCQNGFNNPLSHRALAHPLAAAAPPPPLPSLYAAHAAAAPPTCHTANPCIACTSCASCTHRARAGLAPKDCRPCLRRLCDERVDVCRTLAVCPIHQPSRSPVRL